MQDYLIKRAKIVLKDEVLYGDLLVEEGKISNFCENISADYPEFDAKGNFLCPGLFEIHIHGQGGISFEDLEDKENGTEILQIHQSLQSNGVNTYLPTFTCTEDKISLCMKFFNEFGLFDYYIPGIYIEGPYISPEKKGALPLSSIKNPIDDYEYIEHLWNRFEKRIKILTFAPELKGIEKVIEFMLKNGIIPSIGHSNGTYKDCQKFLHIEKLNMTHLFNAMTQLTHRGTGIAMTPFLNQEVFFEIITDGIHLDDSIVSMVAKHLSKQRQIIISDSSSAAGCPYGKYRHLGSEVISKKEGVFYKDSSIFVGSNKTVNECMKHYQSLTNTPMYEVIRMVTYNPAQLLGLSDRGEIAVSKKADLILLDKEMKCVHNFLTKK